MGIVILCRCQILNDLNPGLVPLSPFIVLLLLLFLFFRISDDYWAEMLIISHLQPKMLVIKICHF